MTTPITSFSRTCDMWGDVGIPKGNEYVRGNYFHFLDVSMFSLFRDLYRRDIIPTDLLEYVEKKNEQGIRQFFELGGLTIIGSEELLFDEENAFKKDLAAVLILEILIFFNDDEADLILKVSRDALYPITYNVWSRTLMEEWKHPLHLNKFDIMAAFDDGPEIAETFLSSIEKHFTQEEIQKAINDGTFFINDFSVLLEMGYLIP